MTLTRPDPKWLVEVWAEAELVTAREITGTREHADAVGAELLQDWRAGSARVGAWEATAMLALRVHGDVFWNGNAPPGWVEICREPSGPSVSDAAVALLVCEAAGVPASCAVRMRRGHDGESYASRLDGPPRGDDFIAVPAIVAWLAHLLDDEQLAAANEDGS